ncbi:MAG: hypothetical protein IKU98_02890, partial [Bacteroidaceae bacterium]|nr:hypothetical protein [Bacteroidaceae bacterium]
YEAHENNSNDMQKDSIDIFFIFSNTSLIIDNWCIKTLKPLAKIQPIIYNNNKCVATLVFFIYL